MPSASATRLDGPVVPEPSAPEPAPLPQHRCDFTVIHTSVTFHGKPRYGARCIACGRNRHFSKGELIRVAAAGQLGGWDTKDSPRGEAPPSGKESGLAWTL